MKNIYERESRNTQQKVSSSVEQKRDEIANETIPLSSSKETLVHEIPRPMIRTRADN